LQTSSTSNTTSGTTAGGSTYQATSSQSKSQASSKLVSGSTTTKEFHSTQTYAVDTKVCRLWKFPHVVLYF